jgi:hypothetical protein
MRAFLDAPLSEEIPRPTARQLISSCEGLIIEDLTSDCVRFLHLTVEQYLWGKVGYKAEAHAVTASLCLAKMSTSKRASSLPFISDERPIQTWERGRSRSREPVIKRRASSDRLSIRSSSMSRRRSRIGSDCAGSGNDSDSGRSGSEFRGGVNRSSQSSRRNDSPNKSAALSRKSKRGTTGTRAYPRPDEPIQDFREYASLYWATHCSMSGDRISLVTGLNNMLLYLVLMNLNHQFPCWIANVRKLFSQRPLGFYDERVERELEKCISEPPSPYFGFLYLWIHGDRCVVQQTFKRNWVL